MRVPLLLRVLCVLLISVLTVRPAAAQNNLVTYAGNLGDERFYDVVRLSDSTYLVAGTADDLNWLPTSITRRSLSGAGIANAGHTIDKIGFLLHLSPDLKTVKSVVYFPAGAVQDIRHIRTDNDPSSATGNIYISGTTIDARQNGGGYFLAKLNTNFVSATPSALSWVYNVYATGRHQTTQPWDVGSDGKIIFIAGQAYGSDSAAVLRLKADGSGPDIVDQWRTHWGVSVLNGKTVGGHWTPANANGFVQTRMSGLRMRNNNYCDLRSWSSTAYGRTQPDGNGSTRKGDWPMDIFYSSACDTAMPMRSLASPGYTNLSAGMSTHTVEAIVVDRRDNSFYIGASAWGHNTQGLGDEEPFVLAFSKDGAMRWWSRLHRESSQNSPPLQQVRALAIDYSQEGSMSALAVLAVASRKSGPNNFWDGNAIANNPLNPGYAFHNKYTGNDSSVQAAWLGRFRLTNGELLHSTWLSGFNGTSALTQGNYTEPIHDSWPSHNLGNPSQSATEADMDMEIDAFGRIYLLMTTTRGVTTKNAYQKMTKPSAAATRAQYLRVLEPDLSKLAYSSVLTGTWNTSGGAGGNNTLLHGVFPVRNGAIVVGYHEDRNADRVSDGNNIPLVRVPAWGNSTPKAEHAILARLTFDTVLNAYFYPNIKTGTCVGTTVTFRDTSIGATSWSWDFGANATPDTASGKGPHQVSWSAADTVQVRLVVSNGTDYDTMTIPYIISAAPSGSITFTGDTTTAPDTLHFSGPSGTGLSYNWNFGDPNSGGANSSTIASPDHVFQDSGRYTVRLTVTSGNCSSTIIRKVHISGGRGPAKPAFTVSQTSGCTNSTLTYTQTDTTNSIDWLWNFGDGASPQTSRAVGPHKVTYSTPGPKTVILTAGNGLTKYIYTQSVIINTPPSASFTFTGNTSTIPSTLIFYGSKCTNCTYRWDFSDPASGANTATDPETVHEFTRYGNYPVIYTVTDTFGCSQTDTQEIVFANPLSQYTRFTIGPAGSTCVGNKVLLTDMSRHQSRSRTWYLGSGASPATSNRWDTVTVSWNTPGLKKITLLGTSFSNSAEQHTVFYEVTDYPDATFTWTGNTGSAPATVQFTAPSGQGYLYRWNFGDSASGAANKANSSSPTHTFSSAGIYTVTLAITRNGCTSYYSTNVYVGMATPVIVPAFSVKPSKNGCRVPEVIFTNQSKGAISSWSWDFGTDATPSSGTGRGPYSVVYGSKGTKTVKLTVGNGTTTQTLSMPIFISY